MNRIFPNKCPKRVLPPVNPDVLEKKFNHFEHGKIEDIISNSANFTEIQLSAYILVIIFSFDEIQMTGSNIYNVKCSVKTI